VEPLVELGVLLHACAGSVVLASAALALGSTKGGRTHRGAGRVFAVAMLVAVALAAPAIVARSNVLLATLGPFSAWMAAAGWRAGRQRPYGPVDASLVAAGAVSVACLLGLGLWSLASGVGLWPVPLVLGGFGVLLVRGEARRLKAPDDRKTRLQAHVGLMVGATIAATTAFAAVNLPGLGVPPLVIWLGPTVVGVLAIRRFSRRFV
jgi:hypothetical protein